ncbi:putative transposase [Desulfolithobacter dissulfuricans]|uniref:Transposase n=1 Tax=Desulfolithobacter dissulfuricans TaxID=2795293 RepID=A0A915XLJ6_9BACT|nr:IS21 family transposase [Desulfolithobacter dissulfuricans]BCO09896.1 putative transposase [Desulfolithobacter dissulfuricans]
MFQYRQILAYMRSGQSDRQIAKAGLMGRAKASEFRRIATEKGWLSPKRPLPDDHTLAAVLKRPRRPASGSILAPYHEKIKSWHRQGISGTTIHQALVRDHGFSGSYSAVRRYLQQLKNDSPEATVMLDFKPGEVAQVDFGKGPKITDTTTGEVFSTWFFVMTLAFSRHQYAVIVRDQKIQTWLGCHRRAFEFFGGIPKKVVVDNLKSAITRACWRDPRIQRSYAELAEGYGFLVSPCPPNEPRKKGRVEAGVKYIKRSFLPLRRFRSLGDANRQLREWIMESAGNRVHGTTRQKPLSLFAEAEKHLLKPLPAKVPELAVWSAHKLHGNCHLQFEKCFYSAPYRLVRKQLWVKATETTVKIFHDHELVAVHPRKHRPGEKSTIIGHLPPDAVAYLMRDPQWCLRQAGVTGPNCLRLIESLFAHRVLDNLRAAQGVIGLAGKYGQVRLEAACRRALFFDSPKYITVKTILAKGLDQLPDDPVPTPLPATYTGKGRFQRTCSRVVTTSSSKEDSICIPCPN